MAGGLNLVNSAAADTMGLTDSATAEIRVTVNGLTMSVDTFNRTLAAIRGLFPELVGNLSDHGAIQMVMAKFMADWVATWESKQASPPLQQVIDTATQAALAAQASVYRQALIELAADVQRTVTD